MRQFVGKNQKHKLKFMDGEVEAKALTVGQVKEVQRIAKNIVEGDGNDLDAVMYVIRVSVDGASDLTNEEFESFSIEEIKNLSEEILAVSGLRDKEKEGN